MLLANYYTGDVAISFNLSNEYQFIPRDGMEDNVELYCEIQLKL